jgi:hypothetical protein
VRGEHVCDNVDVIRNASFSWSPMSAAEIAAKTGIEQRRYTLVFRSFPGAALVRGPRGHAGDDRFVDLGA